MISTKATFVLLILLGVPFVLTTFGFEPYPAIILPSGAGNIRKQGNQIDIPLKKIFGLNSQTQWAEIDPVRFSYPMHIQYYPLLLDTNLGFKDVKLTWREKWIEEKTGIRRKKHQPGTSEVVAYIQHKLSEQNLDTTQIKIVDYIETVSLENNRSLSTKIVHEEIIYLRR